MTEPESAKNNEPEPAKKKAKAHPRTAELRRSVSSAAERIEEILDAAESIGEDLRNDAEVEAERIRDEARAEADRYLAASKLEVDRVAEEQVSRLEDALEALRSQLRSIEEQGSAMVGAVEDAIERVKSAPTPPTPDPETSPGPTDRRPLSPAPVTPDGEASEQSPGGDERGENGARQAALIRATQLAVGGSDREEIEETLRREFEVEDPAAVAREILGKS